MQDPQPQPWWIALDQHRQLESEARHKADDKLSERVDNLEAWRDQLRGAGRLVYMLIGSNLLLALTLVVSLLK